jgi:hypothetical protein
LFDIFEYLLALNFPERESNATHFSAALQQAVLRSIAFSILHAPFLSLTSCGVTRIGSFS